jgi:Leucine-rich repeat (LRR) protein
MAPCVAARADETPGAARTLESKGAKIERDTKTRDKPVVKVNMAKLAVNDEDLALLESFEWLESLDLSDTPITDAGLTHLVGLKKLKKLDLMHTNTFTGLTDLREKIGKELKIDHPLAALAETAKGRPEGERRALALLARFPAEFHVDDKDKQKPVVGIALRDMPVPDVLLAALPDLPALRSLDLSLSPLKGADLAPLGRLDRLENLSLYSTGVGDAALATIKGLKQLRSLNVAYDPVTDKGLDELNGLAELQTLILYHTKVTDEGMARLATLTKLQELSLSGTAVSDKGLAALRGLGGLRLLSLSDTKVTDAGIKDLVKSAPMVKVQR